MIRAAVYHRSKAGDVYVGEAHIDRLPSAGQPFVFIKRWIVLSVWILKGYRATIVVKPMED